MTTESGSSRRADLLLVFLSGALFLLEIVPNLFGGYGYFIDELYYIACSDRLALGYVDHPPFAPFLLRLNRAFLGDSIPSIRFLPALSGAASVYLTGLMARRMGAGLFGQGLAALSLVVAPVPLIFFGFFSMNAFEILIWVAGCFVLVELARTGNERLWLMFGLIAGVGLQNKHTFVLLGVGLAVGLLLTPERRYLASKWLWLGAALALVLFLPNIWWQIQNGWPSLEFYRNADIYKNVPTPPLTVLLNQILFMSPATLPIWLAGLVFCLGSRAGRSYRFIGWIFVTLMLLMLIGQKSRPDRIAGIYPVLFAAGATWWDSVVRRAGLRWTRWALPALLILFGLLFAPLSLPLLPPEQLARYSAAAGIVPKLERGSGKISELPQWFADRFGWEELVAMVANVADELSPDERGRALILVPSYGHAGAIELFGPRYDLPPVASAQNNYYLWGPGEGPADVIISIGFGPDPMSEFFEDVRQVSIYRCEYCMSWRDNTPIYVAREPKAPFREAWPRFKHYE
jgi:4-amino-4-deoxy-L-arabinose transferase-like glycosyltransferase